MKCRLLTVALAVLPAFSALAQTTAAAAAAPVAKQGRFAELLAAGGTVMYILLLISVVILVGTWRLLRDSLRLALNAAPREIDLAAVREYLESLPEVGGLHDLHIWAMSTTETALTCHIVTPAGHPGDAFLHQVAHELEHRFKIGHTTVQIELEKRDACPTACQAAR